MKKQLTILFLLISCIAAAQTGTHHGYPYFRQHGDTATLDSNSGGQYIYGRVYLNTYATSDTDMVLGINSSGMLVLRHKGGGGMTAADSAWVLLQTGGGGATIDTVTKIVHDSLQNFLPLTGGSVGALNVNGNFIVADPAGGNTLLNADLINHEFTLGDRVSGNSLIHLIGTVDINGQTPMLQTDPAGGDLAGTYPNPTLTTSGVVAGTYGTGSRIPVFDVDAKGRITSASNVSISGAPPTGTAGGDLTGTYPNPTLTTSGVTASTYGSSTESPRFTVDAKGRITGVTNTTITGVVPGGSAGGDLTGTYPNPTLVATAVSAGSYTNASITVDAKGRLTAASSGTAPITSVSGTVTRISSTGGATPVIDLVTANPTPATSGSGTAIPVITYDAYGRVTSVTTATPTPAYINVTGTPSALPPNGSASGDLTGNYPNPTVAASAITNAKVSASAAIAYSKLNLATSIVAGDISATGTPSSTTFYCGNGTWSTPHGYIGTRYFTSIGASTYTPTAGTTRIKVYGVAGGGGSTGSKTGASAAASGGGGGSGGYFEASIGSFTWTSTTITVGAAGTAGLATGANSVAPTGGGNGGNTTFVNGATTITAFGGSGSLYALLGGTVHHSAGGDGGLLSTNGDFNVGGSPGSPGIGENATSAGAGNGGASHYGGAGKGSSALNTSGSAATGYGSGGGGSTTGSTNTNNIDGTAGFQGIIIIEEYF